VAFSNARPKLKIGLCPDRPQSAKNQQVQSYRSPLVPKDGMTQHPVIDGIYYEHDRVSFRALQSYH
jgi:hypothetical protein